MWLGWETCIATTDVRTISQETSDGSILNGGMVGWTETPLRFLTCVSGDSQLPWWIYAAVYGTMDPYIQLEYSQLQVNKQNSNCHKTATEAEENGASSPVKIFPENHLVKIWQQQ